MDQKFTPTPVVLEAIVEDVSSKIAYESGTDYTFEITPKAIIPAGAKIIVTFPSVISLPSGTDTCAATIGASGYTCTSTGTTGPVVTLTGAFDTSYTTKDTAF